MADKLRKQKEISKNLTDVYNQTIQDYAKYIDGSGGIPVYVTYYQISSEASTTDWSLEVEHSLIGANSPIKYNRIFDVPIYSTDAVTPDTNLTERGLESLISGEFVLLPNTLVPNVNDFFSFDAEGMENHLFRIIDVQYDKATSNKFYKCTYELYPDSNHNKIFDNVIEDFVADMDQSENGSNGVIKKKDADIASKAQLVIDSLIEKYEVLFYDVEMDLFSCVNDNKAPHDSRIYYYSPYVQHFIHKNQIVRRYTEEFMKEIYITDIDEYSFPEIYDELAYRNSIFYATETQDADLPFESTLMAISDYDLSQPLNLPFFTSEYTYKLLELCTKPKDKKFLINSFHFLLGSPEKLCIDAEPQYRFVDEEDLEDKIENPEISETMKPLNLLYQVENANSILPINTLWITDDGDIIDAAIKNMILSIDSSLKPCDPNKPMPEKPHNDDYELGVMFEVVKKYITNTLKIDEALLEKINMSYTSRTIKDYILMPLVIYALKKSI